MDYRNIGRNTQVGTFGVSLELSLTQDFIQFRPGLVMFIQIWCVIGTFDSQSGNRIPTGYVKYFFNNKIFYTCNYCRPYKIISKKPASHSITE